MNAAANWFYLKDEQRIGPVSQEQLCDMFRRGFLNLQTMVFSEAFKEWTPAASISGLRALCLEQEPAALAASRPSLGMLDYQTPQEDAGPRGIGGWLILPAIGIVISILRQAVLTLGLWVAADKVGSVAKAGSGAETLRVLALLWGAFTVYLLFTAVLFFGKKRSAPAAVIGMYLGAIGLSGVALIMLPQNLTTSAAAGAAWITMAQPVAIALVWIPYFSCSRRVKLTFVN